MPFQGIAQFLRNLFLQRFNLFIHEFDHFARAEINQMVMMVAICVFVTGASIPEFMFIQNARFFEQFHGAINGCD